MVILNVDSCRFESMTGSYKVKRESYISAADSSEWLICILAVMTYQKLSVDRPIWWNWVSIRGLISWVNKKQRPRTTPRQYIHSWYVIPQTTFESPSCFVCVYLHTFYFGLRLYNFLITCKSNWRGGLRQLCYSFDIHVLHVACLLSRDGCEIDSPQTSI